MPRSLLIIVLWVTMVTSMPSTLSMTQALKRAVKHSDRTIYAIAKETGLQKASLIRFMDGRTSLRLAKADLLAKFLGLELRPRRAKRNG